MVVQHVRRVSAARQRGNEQRRGAEAAQPIRVAGGAGGVRNRRGRGRHVVEEPAPLVEIDEQHRPLPRRTRADGGVDPIEERLAGPDVAEGMIVRPRSGRLREERPVDECHLGQRPGTAIGEEFVQRPADRDILGAPQPEEGHIAVVIASLEAARGQSVPDGRQGRQGGRVAQPVGLSGMLVDPVRKGGPQDRTEITVERCPLRYRATQEGEVFLPVVTDRERIVDAEPAVAPGVVVFHAPALVRMVRIRVTAPLEIRSEGIGGVAHTGRIEVGEPGLPSVGIRQPSEEMVERPVLHHHDDDVLDPARAGIKRQRARGARQQRDAHRAIHTREGETAGCGCGGGQERTARQDGHRSPPRVAGSPHAHSPL